VIQTHEWGVGRVGWRERNKEKRGEIEGKFIKKTREGGRRGR